MYTHTRFSILGFESFLFFLSDNARSSASSPRIFSVENKIRENGRIWYDIAETRALHAEKEYQLSKIRGRIINHRLLSIILNHSPLTTSSQSCALIDAIFENCCITFGTNYRNDSQVRYNFSLGTLSLSLSREIRRNPVTLMAGCLISGIGSLITV